MSTARLEAFSDGVLAVAITLLVLNISVPPDARSLAHGLGKEWPAYAAYVTSFLTIGIIWINHHAMISRLARADHAVLILNLLLLMAVVVIPFGTSLLAQNLRGSHADASLAAAVYGGTLLAMALAFTALNRYVLLRHPELMRLRLSEAERRTIYRRAVTGVLPYLLATALAAASAYATLILSFALAAFYALPIAVSAEMFERAED